jgi:DNA-binding MltR family transcriptional regulator
MSVLSSTEVEISSILAELQAQSDRGCAIIAASILEELLEELLKKRLIGGTAMMERLFSFDKNGPLAHFKAKIDIAYSIGLISAEKRADLHAIRDIRNRFAHRVEPIDFSDKKIEAWCAKFHDFPDIQGTRRRFTLRVSLIAMATVLQTTQFTEKLTETMKDVGDEELERFFDGLIASLEASPGKSQ